MSTIYLIRIRGRKWKQVSYKTFLSIEEFLHNNTDMVDETLLSLTNDSIVSFKQIGKGSLIDVLTLEIE